MFSIYFCGLLWYSFNMDIFQIETFLAIVNTKSISKAAKKLFISQPTVSHRLSMLEKELGMALVERGQGIRGTRLTPNGEKFVIIAYKWYDLWHDVELLMNSQQKLPVSLGYTESMNIQTFSSLYKSLIRGERGVLFDLNIVTERSTEIHKMIETRDLDIGFVYSLHPNSNILITPLFSEKLLVVKLRSAEDALRTGFHPAELDGHHEIYSNWSYDYQMWHQNFWGSTVIPFVKLDSEYLIMDYLDDQNLWAIVPQSVATYMKKANPEIEAYDLLENPPHRICYKITHRLPKENRVNNINLFTNFVVEFISTHEDLSLAQ